MLVTNVAPRSPAQAAGLVEGDFIASVGGTPVRTPAEFYEAVRRFDGDVCPRPGRPPDGSPWQEVMMKTDELRESYLTFFQSKGCVRKPSDVLVPRDDPTVLFTPAGMNQFKAQFLGVGKLEFTRATTCQMCLRTGDIQNVGVTAYHHTFFEMLGNFSFGDYFKEEAIHWAWEYLTDKKWLGLAPDRLSTTVYLDDDEAFNIWTKKIGLPPDRVRREDENENFWPAGAPSNGPDGVCGPCSEIYYQAPGSPKSVEIWNLVFTQFNRVGAPPNNLRPLPKKNIDTGMGLERTASVLQGVPSNFEIDILRPLCLAAADAVGIKYDFAGVNGRPDPPHRRPCPRHHLLHPRRRFAREREGKLRRAAAPAAGPVGRLSRSAGTSRSCTNLSRPSCRR